MKKSTAKSNALTSSERTDAILEKFGELLIQKLNSIGSDFKKPWFNVKSSGMPQNLTGRQYNNQNAIMLFFMCDLMNFNTPVFLTFNQAKEEGLMIRKGSVSFPVYLTMPVSAYHINNGEVIGMPEYNKLTEREQLQYRLKYGHKSFNVFNLDQTNIAETNPAKWQTILNKFTPIVTVNTTGYKHTAIDSILQEQSWVCPINVRTSDQAYYNMGNDSITMPKQEQFIDGQSFYISLLHEMAHSTGTKSRLDRKGFYDSDTLNYGREELVAELTAALSGIQTGLYATIQDNNLKYLKKWCENIKEDPRFIMTVLSDVNQAQKFIIEKLGAELQPELYNAAISDVKVAPQKSESLKSIERTLTQDRAKSTSRIGQQVR